MMEKKKKRILFGALAVILFMGIASAGTMYYYLFTPQFHPQKTVYIYIDRDDTTDSIYNKIKAQGKPNSFNGSNGCPNGAITPTTSTPGDMRYVPARTFTMYSTVSTEDTKPP